MFPATGSAAVLFLLSVLFAPDAAQRSETKQGRVHAPYISDAAICNEEASAETITPDASPGTPVPPSAPDPGALRPAPPLTPRPGMQLDRSGSIVVRSTDPWLEGMAKQGVEDDAYRAAYRECIERRLQRRR